ncbi:MAG: glycosyltransferase [bacterium]|nr:glycosyltransferase [bacterium]
MLNNSEAVFKRDIDIVIPACDRIGILMERLPSYWNQKQTRKVFIVDGSRNANTEEVKELQGFIKKSPVPVFYYKFPQHQLQQVCKNFGVEKSDAPYVFIGEDDVELSPNHLEILLETLERNNADMVGGRRMYIKDTETQTQALENAPRKGKIFYQVPFEAYFENPFSGETQVQYLHSNALIKREVFDSVRYDPNYRGNAFREELDFYLGCLRMGKVMFLTSNTACFHLKSERKMGNGSQITRSKYEFYVWVNTIKCFWKNRDVLKKSFNIKAPMVYALVVLFARYTHGLKRRITRFLNYVTK